MKFLRLLTAAAAAATALTCLVAPQAQAAIGPTPNYPNGVAAPHSPGGVPSAGIGPIMTSKTDASARATFFPGLAPQGVNDFTCVPLPGDRPVVLVPGTGEDAFATWSWIAPQLANAGYCVYTFNFNPSLGPAGAIQESNAFSGDIKTSATFMASFVDRVLAATGASQVDLVGHSQGGGALPRAYMKWNGGAAKVHQLVGIVPNNYGTTVNGMETLLLQADEDLHGVLTDYATAHNMQASPQQLQGSAFFTELNAGTVVYPTVRYTVISTTNDNVITPYTNAFLPARPNVTNTTIQASCPSKTNSHDEMLYDVAVYQLVYNALNPDNQSLPINCTATPQA